MDIDLPEASHNYNCYFLFSCLIVIADFDKVSFSLILLGYIATFAAVNVPYHIF